MLQIKPHKAVKTSSISRWLKDVPRLSGIDTSQFSGHSTRSVSSTLATNSGVSIPDIMKVAEWSRAGTFTKSPSWTLMLTESCFLHPPLEIRSHMMVKMRLTEDNFKSWKGKYLPARQVELSSVYRVDPSCPHPINSE